MLFRNKDERIADFSEMFVENGCEEYLRDQKLMAYLNDGGFFTAPASTKYHGVYEGGLYDHSRSVAGQLIKLTEMLGLRWQRHDSPLLVGMFHDLCKCDQYIKVNDQPEGYHYEHAGHLLLEGHGAKSVMILSQFMTLTPEEILCIRYHMGAYEVDDWNGYDMAICRYPNVLFTHTADMYASKVFGT